MLSLPFSVQIGDHTGDRPCPARIIKMDEAVAETIDQTWWIGYEDYRDTKQDGHWEWVTVVREYAQWHGNSCVALTAEADDYLGAMVYAVNGISQFDPDKSALTVHYVAARPGTRSHQPGRKYRRCGVAMMAFAAAVSYDLGLSGAVVLNSLPQSEDFYKRLGFEQTGGQHSGMNTFELRPEAACSLLRQMGWITDD